MGIRNVFDNTPHPSLYLDRLRDAGHRELDPHRNRYCGANVHILGSRRKPWLSDLDVVRIEWDICESKRARRIGHRRSLKSRDGILYLDSSANNHSAGRIDDSAFNRAACHRLSVSRPP